MNLLTNRLLKWWVWCLFKLDLWHNKSFLCGHCLHVFKGQLMKRVLADTYSVNHWKQNLWTLIKWLTSVTHCPFPGYGHLIKVWLPHSSFPHSCQQRHQFEDWVQRTKYSDLYEIVHQSLNLISLCLLMVVEYGKGPYSSWCGYIEYPHQVQGWNTGLRQLVTFDNLHSETVINIF